jgi:hypothetical protein
LALLVLAVKLVPSRLEQQALLVPYRQVLELAQESVQVREQLLRVQLVQQIELAAQMK